MKLIWVSDLHFSPEGDVLGHNPRKRLAALVDHINSHHADADCCIFTGDMVNRASQTGYQSLGRSLEALNLRVFPMVGNHDDRNLLRQSLSVPDNCMADFIQYSISTSQGRIICLDTKKNGSDAGEFCDLRSRWLQNELEECGEEPVYLFMHHPPHKLELPMQDTENMEHGDNFLDLISSYDCVKYLFIGHVHRPITGTVRGLPFSTMRSALYQAPAPRPEWNWDTFKPVQEAPSMGVITISDGTVVIQYEEFCRFETGGCDL